MPVLRMLRDVRNLVSYLEAKKPRGTKQFEELLLKVKCSLSETRVVTKRRRRP